MTWADERAELHAQLAADCGVEPTTIRDVFAQLGAAFGASTTTFPDDVDVGAIVRAAFRKDHERNWKAREVAQLGAAFGASTTTFPDDVDVGAIVRAAFRKDHERNWKAREARDAERVGRADDEG